MFQLNDDKSIYVTRGDAVFFSVTANNDGEAYVFQPGDLVRIKVYGKKNCENVVLEKDFPVTTATESVDIYLDKNDTKIGDVISKPTDYWYEVELNPLSDPHTIIGYDEDGARVFKLFPEGADIEVYVPTEEDIPFVDDELDLTSPRPVANQAISRAFYNLQSGNDITQKMVSGIYLTPAAFGAKGDGVTDDTKAFKEAMEYINKGSTLHLCGGTYLLSSAVDIAKDIHINGASGTIIGRGLYIKSGTSVTMDGVAFKDIGNNAVTADENCKLALQNCVFENIGTASGIDVTSQGCGVHVRNGFDLTVNNCKFTACHGHGAVFCQDGGTLVVKDSQFDENDYRAISFYGTEPIKGIISGNYIADCGKNNKTGSGVACNGIFCPNGYGVVCENNTILRSRENAIEGAFLKIVGNYIDGTGFEKDAKPTPSIEGIWYESSAPAYIANNVILNAGGSGIKTYRENDISEPAYIVGNIIRNCGNTNAIDIGSATSVDNLYLADNKVDDYVRVTKSKRTNIYIGDISVLDIVGNIDLTKNYAVSDFHHYFDKFEPFTYKNCTPQIKTEGGEKYVEVVYDTYARLVLDIPYLQNTYHMLNFSLYAKGKFTVNLQKNGSYYKTICSVDSKEYIDKDAVVGLLGAASDKFTVTIEFQHQSDVATGQEDCSCIKTVDMQIYR